LSSVRALPNILKAGTVARPLSKSRLFITFSLKVKRGNPAFP
jgi:hypothetical protein